MEAKNEIVDSVKQELGRRMLSPVFGTFVIYWTIFHWQFLVSLFFVSSEQIWQSERMLKTDYLKISYMNWSDPYFYLAWVFSVLMTVLTIWKFPDWFLLKADQLDTDYRVEREKIRINGEKEIIGKEIAKEVISTKKIQKEITKVQTANKLSETLTDEQKWLIEYEEFKKHQLFKEYSQILNCVYKNGGYLQSGTTVDPDVLAIADVKELVDFMRDENRIALTKKGKIFADKFLETTTLYAGDIDPRTIPF